MCQKLFRFILNVIKDKTKIGLKGTKTEILIKLHSRFRGQQAIFKAFAEIREEFISTFASSFIRFKGERLSLFFFHNFLLTNRLKTSTLVATKQSRWPEMRIEVTKLAN